MLPSYKLIEKVRCFLNTVTSAFLIEGINHFCKDIETMIGSRPSTFWKVMWCGVTPLIIFGILVSMAVQFVNPIYGNYKWPLWTLLFGWTVGCACHAGYFLILVVRDDLNKTCTKLMCVHLVHLIM